jgi:maleylpyruvate isomerase
MASLLDDGEGLAAAIARRTDEVVAALRSLDEPDLLSPSELPGWSRLTIACHLRYGATALAPMTDAALADLTTSYYPGGRDGQRPGTLSPEPGETPRAVVASLAERSADLDARWGGLTPDDWSRPVREPEDLPDLGTLTLAQLALLRLTEVEVHGTDLGLGLADWSPDFVDTALPFRVDRLHARRPTPGTPDPCSWLLVASDGPTFRVSVSGRRVGAGREDPAAGADATIDASSRDLLALLLGRPLLAAPVYRGDVDLGRAFTIAFPGP